MMPLVHTRQEYISLQLFTILIVFVCLHVIKTTSSMPMPPRQQQQRLSSGYFRKPVDDNYHIIEDDIKLTDSNPYASESDVWLRSAASDRSKAWTNGVVPYYIDITFFSDIDVDTIYQAIDEFHQKTCVRFIPRTTETPYLYITPLSRCWSEIGMPLGEGIRTLSLGNACLERRGTVIHELMHVLGFWHEQNRADRDDYIDIHWENIRDGLEHNFYKYSGNKVDTFNESYDYRSIMHYSSFAFAKDPREPTIVPKIPMMIGQRFELSPVDIRKIQKLYNCSTSNNWHHFSQKEDPSGIIQFPHSEHSSFPPFSSSSSSSSTSNSFKGSSSNPDILFPNLNEYVPLPFKFNWTRTTSNPRIVFPSS